MAYSRRYSTYWHFTLTVTQHDFIATGQQTYKGHSGAGIRNDNWDGEKICTIETVIIIEL